MAVASVDFPHQEKTGMTFSFMDFMIVHYPRSISSHKRQKKVQIQDSEAELKKSPSGKNGKTYGSQKEWGQGAMVSLLLS